MFEAPYAHVLRDTLVRAMKVYHDGPERWAALMRKGMAQQVSWLAPADAYRQLYADLLP